MTTYKNINFAIDRGGTFTDVYAEYGNRQFALCKLLSEDPQNYDDAPREGIRRLLEKINNCPISPHAIPLEHINQIRMGTTVATNALLERKGERTALLITRGFADLLQIGYQNRPDIFDLQIQKPSLLYDTVIEIDERIRPVCNLDNTEDILTGISGERFKILHRPNLNKIRKDLLQIKKLGIDSIAVVLLHAYTCPEHELQIKDIAIELGFKQVSISSEVMPMIKAISRGDTTVVDAYLTPHIRQYLNSFSKGFCQDLPANTLQFMQSDGGLSPAQSFRGSNAIFSGPAGGVVGFAMTTYNALEDKPVIGFDMGGTSTDVSRFAGNYEITHETETAGVRIQAPQLNIKTVAAGGGSRLFFKNSMFVVGPESSGAHPGPVCYRKNGFLSVTDANLILGRIQPEFFPKIFGKNEDQPLDQKGVEIEFKKITKKINQTLNSSNSHTPVKSIEQVALGFIEVANQEMARAIREISSMRGYDVKEHILASFGGAGGQHACAIARILGIKEIYIHRFSGILSAYGMMLADSVVEKQQPANVTLAQQLPESTWQELAKLESNARRKLKSQGFTDDKIQCQKFLNMRFAGSDTGFMVEVNKKDNIRQIFTKGHIREFGFELKNRAIKITDIRVRATAQAIEQSRQPIAPSLPNIKPQKITSCFFDKNWQPTPVYQLNSLGAGFSVTGPALIINETSTTILEPDCTLKINNFGDLKITVSQRQNKSISINKDPVQMAIFANLFMSIAEQMGRTLQRTAVSTNIKERLDYSCAIFDATGRLIANAPHIPVHLGAMGAAVQEQIKLVDGNLNPGDVLVSNHPIAGGSHLPDITVITPVWRDNIVIFYTASRGHHADIGGITPGSMPPFSKKLADEGTSIISFKLAKNGVFDETGIRALLKGCRRIDDNISDLKAQTAANQKGIDLLLEMVNSYGLATVSAYMGFIHDCAAESVREMIRNYCADHKITEKQTMSAVDYMDDGSVIALAIELDPHRGKVVFDFNGTAQQVTGNWNIPPAVVTSTIIFCLRSMTKSDLPLNQGCLEPVTIKIPKGSLLSPSEDAAVVGGNVLTSQRITDLIFKAFGVMAASQGCMNNITFGNDHFGYYETIGGGAGAGPAWSGQSGVHTNMTNTRITDPEVLEKNYPVMLQQFSIRQNSGGKGKFNGGDGLIREYEALEPLRMAVLTERRVYAPFGMNGGGDGATGKNLLIDDAGAALDLGGKNQVNLEPGQRLKILTPGGGGWGK